MLNRLLASALYYLKTGWSVIPINRDKVPLISQWGEFQTRKPTEDEVRNWWTKWPTANVAVVTGQISDLVVVDVDEKEGLHHVQALPPTLMSRTGGGGLHLFYKRGDNAVPNAVRIRRGVDVRGDGGLIVVPPSIHASGRQYQWLNKLAPAPLPDTIKEWFVDRRASALWSSLVPAGQRNNEVTKRTGKLLAAGLDPADVLDFMLNWNRKHCVPALDDNEVRQIVESIVKRVAKHEESFDVVSTEDLGLHFGQEKPEWLIEDWLPAQTTGLVVAPPESYKTWLLIELAVAVATGRPFLGQFTVQAEPSNVLFIQQEDPFPMLVDRLSCVLNLDEVKQENDALTFRIPPDNLKIAWHTSRSLHMTNKNIVLALEKAIERLRPSLVIIDPLYSIIRTDDYGAAGAQEMLALKQIRDNHGCAFMIAHHTRKSTPENCRERDKLWGSQFLNAWLETGWQVRNNGTNEILVRRHFKTCVRPPSAVIRFEINPGRFEVTVMDDEEEDTQSLLQAIVELQKGNIRSVRDLSTRLGHAGLGTANRILKTLGAKKTDDGFYRLPEGFELDLF